MGPCHLVYKAVRPRLVELTYEVSRKLSQLVGWPVVGRTYTSRPTIRVGVRVFGGGPLWLSPCLTAPALHVSSPTVLLLFPPLIYLERPDAFLLGSDRLRAWYAGETTPIAAPSASRRLCTFTGRSSARRTRSSYSKKVQYWNASTPVSISQREKHLRRALRQRGIILAVLVLSNPS